jgi:hypothetical protein
MGSVVAPVVVEDVDQDGELEIIVVDNISNLAAYTPDGKLKWSVQLTPGCITAPSIGDVNGNGVLDIVLSCSSGVVHVM